MTKQLKDIKNIRMKAIFNPFYLVKKNCLLNYFRIFKKNDENIEDNHFCSPFFSRGSVLPMNEHFGDRVNAKDTIAKEIVNKKFLSIYLVYDFRFSAVNYPYHTNGEFTYIKWVLEKALKDTGLYLCFIVSHFNQIATFSPRTLKKEHYHVLISKEMNMDEIEYDVAINQFADNLKKSGWIDVMFEN